MALFVNRVQLAGNLTRDPQVRFFADSKAVANFGIAINRRYRTAGGEQRDETTFVDVECWGRTAELVGQYLSKGSGCLVEGSLKLDQWERDGQRRSQLKVVAQMVHFVDQRGSAENGEQRNDEDQGMSGSSLPAAPESFEDEPPF